jgi:hypothetical protein
MPTSENSVRLSMFNMNDKDKETSSSVSAKTAKSSSTVAPPSLMTEGTTLTSEKEEIRNVVRDMNTGEIKEVKWVDPAMRANTRPWEMSWY